MPQNLKSSPSTALDDLPILSVEEEAFVQAIAIGKGHSEAYREAYGAHGYNANSLKVAASRKAASPKIQRHLRSLQSVGLTNISLTREDRIRDELAFAQRAEDAGNYGAAGQARDRVNQLLGLKVERFEDVTAVNTDPIEALRNIEREYGAETARKAAQRLNMPWPIPSAVVQPEATQH
jgi:hypothetical protein